MRTDKEIELKIKELREGYAHVLEGNLATVFENAPRALMQVDAEARLATLHWVLEKEFRSLLRSPGSGTGHLKKGGKR